MSSNIKIEKVCQYCGAEFTAKTTKTKYCSHKCASRAYKARQRDGKIRASLTETIQIKESEIEELKAKDFLSITETYKLLGVSRRTVYRMIERGDLKATKIGGRTIVRRTDIDKLFEQPKPEQPKEKPKYEYNITINEAIEKYKISEKAFYDFRRRHNIPGKKKGKYTYIPESLIKEYLK
jgi:excisionase family DNA binding protein